jgi:hypothetical protein
MKSVNLFLERKKVTIMNYEDILRLGKLNDELHNLSDESKEFLSDEFGASTIPSIDELAMQIIDAIKLVTETVAAASTLSLEQLIHINELAMMNAIDEQQDIYGRTPAGRNKLLELKYKYKEASEKILKEI